MCMSWIEVTEKGRFNPNLLYRFLMQTISLSASVNKVAFSIEDEKQTQDLGEGGRIFY